MYSNNKNNIYKKGESFFYKLGFFMGYHSYKIDAAVSAPAICYAGLLLTSIVFIVISVICTDTFLLDGFFTNLGYGIFCSTFVAVLVDYGATKRKKEKDNNDYRSFTMKVKQNINSLIDFRIHNEFKYKELSRLTYCQWISGLFNIESTAPEYKKIRTEFIDICKRLLFSVLSLKDYSGILAGNFYLPDRFFNHLDNLCEQPANKKSSGNSRNYPN